MPGGGIGNFYKTYLKPNGLMEAFILILLVAASVGAIVLLAIAYSVSL